MEKLLKEHELKIEEELYQQVMLLIENEYNVEGIIDVGKKNDTKLIFKNKKAIIQKVAQVIEKFAEENNLEINTVKNYLFKIIEKRVDISNIFIEESKEAKEIILTDNSEER